MQQPPPSTRWVMYSPGPPNPEPPPPLPSWVQSIAAGPKATFGEFEDCPTISEVLAEGWICAVIPEYIIPHSLVASIRSPEGKYAMLFFQAVGPELHRQPRESHPELIGWFHIRLSEPIADRNSLVRNLLHAMGLLANAKLIPPNAIRPPRAEA